MNKIRKYYEKNPMGAPSDESEQIKQRYKLISDFIEDKSFFRTLDLGCGKELLMKEIKMNSQQFIGVDISKNSIKSAKKTNNGIHFIVSDASELPFDSKTFDCIICSEVLEHIPKFSKSLSEISRICKKNSFLIITTPNYFIQRLYKKIKFLKPYKFREGEFEQVYDKPIPYILIKKELEEKHFKEVILTSFYYSFFLQGKFINFLSKFLEKKVKIRLGHYLFFIFWRGDK